MLASHTFVRWRAPTTSVATPHPHPAAQMSLEVRQLPINVFSLLFFSSGSHYLYRANFVVFTRMCFVWMALMILTGAPIRLHPGQGKAPLLKMSAYKTVPTYADDVGMLFGVFVATFLYACPAFLPFSPQPAVGLFFLSSCHFAGTLSRVVISEWRAMGAAIACVMTPWLQPTPQQNLVHLYTSQHSTCSVSHRGGGCGVVRAVDYHASVAATPRCLRYWFTAWWLATPSSLTPHKYHTLGLLQSEQRSFLKSLFARMGAPKMQRTATHTRHSWYVHTTALFVISAVGSL